MDDAAHLATALADRYEVQKEIGRGGMATVYLARDVKHHRSVALKVLNPELGAVLGVERFLSEIRVTANLQHPNLLPLFDSGEANGLLFYVMPFIEGESLRARLDREKQLPVAEALRIGVAIAGALDYAHRHGVIHRDLKPENVLLHEGQPLVADFGIALAVSNAGGARVTQTGLSLGTPQYMSPEQATGDRAIDGRTDIYSLGALLYEMLTGEPPHSGTTAQAIIARVLTDKPRPVRSSRSSVPEHVEWAIEHALEKLPADRFATAHDFAAALEGSTGTARSIGITSASSSAGGPARQRKRSLFVGAAVVLAAILGVAGGLAFGRTGGQARESIAFTMEAPDIDGVKGSFQVVSIAPDGQTLGFIVVGDTSARIFVRRLSELAPHVLTGSDRAYDLFFSPDGKSIGFFTIDGILRRVGIDGTNLVTLGNTPSFYTGGVWTANQQIILGQQGDSKDLFQTTVGGGSVKPLTTGAKIALARPVLSPDGKTILYVEWGPGFTEDDFFGIADRTTGKFTTSKVLIAAPIGVVDGHAIVTTSDGGIRALPFDARAQRVTGDAIQIEEPGTTLTQGNNGGIGLAAMSVTGTVAYLRGTNDGRLTLSDSVDSQPLGAEKRAFTGPVFSPDGRRIAVAVLSQRGDTAVSDIFLFDVATRTLNRLTSRGDAVGPKWTADGKSIVFSTWFEAKPSAWRQPIDGTAAERLVQIPSLKGAMTAISTTPDGHGLVYGWSANSGPSPDLFYVPPSGDRAPRKLATGSTLSIDPAISPDGQWVAFSGADDAVHTNIFVMPLDGRGARVQVSADGGDLPRWSRDGTRLYYRHSGGIAMVTLKRTGAAVEVVGRAVPLFPKLQHLIEYDIAPDGKHALTVKRDATDLRLVVVTNWAQRVRARIAEAKGGK